MMFDTTAAATAIEVVVAGMEWVANVCQSVTTTACTSPEKGSNDAQVSVGSYDCYDWQQCAHMDVLDITDASWAACACSACALPLATGKPHDVFAYRCGVCAHARCANQQPERTALPDDDACDTEATMCIKDAPASVWHASCWAIVRQQQDIACALCGTILC